jgi:hypothetical protein
MPVLNGPACLTGANCPVVLFPKNPTACERSFRKGGVNDLYFIPCSKTLSLANLTDLAFWQAMVTANELGNVGIGLGSIARESVTTEKVGSETIEEVTGMKWGLTYTIKNFDKTSADVTSDQMNKLIRRFPSFLLIARMSDGDDTVLPIGAFVTSDFNWTVPEDSNNVQNIQFKLTWDEFGFPKQYTVAGLNAVVPKAR